MLLTRVFITSKLLNVHYAVAPSYPVLLSAAHPSIFTHSSSNRLLWSQLQHHPSSNNTARNVLPHVPLGVCGRNSLGYKSRSGTAGSDRGLMWTWTDCADALCAAAVGCTSTSGTAGLHVATVLPVSQLPWFCPPNKWRALSLCFKVHIPDSNRLENLFTYSYIC